MGALFAWLGPRLFNPKDYQLKGEIVVIDPTEQVLPWLSDAYDPVQIRERRDQALKEAQAEADKILAKWQQERALITCQRRNVFGPTTRFKLT